MSVQYLGLVLIEDHVVPPRATWLAVASWAGVVLVEDHIVPP